MLDRWGGVVARRAWAVLLVGVALVLAAGAYGAGVFGALSQGGFDDADSGAAKALVAEREAFGNRGVDVVAVYDAGDRPASDPAVRDAVLDVVAGYPAGAVSTVITPWAPDGSGPAPELVSEDGTAVQVLVSLQGVTQDDFLDSYDELAPALEAPEGSGLTTDVAGTYAVYADVNEITEADAKRAELMSAPIVLVLALLVFGSLVAASMPLLVGVVAVLGALAVVRLLTEFTEVSVFSVNVITLLGLGLAIDYALFVVSRFREELAVLGDRPGATDEALRRTMTTAGRTVLFSGLTVAASMASLLVFPQAFLRSMGYGGVAAVLVAVVAALTILPAVLRLLGPRVDAGRLPWRRHQPVQVESATGRWASLARGVMRRPVTVVVVTTAGLLLLASPFLRVEWGSVDHRVLPEDAPSRVAAERIATEFGPETSTASIVVRGTTPDALADYVAELGTVPGVVDVQQVAADDALLAGGEGDALLRAAWEGTSQSQASQALVEDLREVQPAAGDVLVGGLTADTVDLKDSVGAHLPLMGLIVVAVMLVLLFLAFGSVVLPIKAVVMNVVSIGAAFGVVTWIFAEGNLESVLGFESQGFLDATNPILMLAILFGLSMDYEVFLLSRVREEWDRTGDNEQAVVAGVQKTGRIITSAALLLGVVIGAFSTSGIQFMKELGVGMLVALLIDATVVRALLVPASMRLLGRANWWAPGPLARWWDRHGFREGGDPEAPAPAAEAPGVPQREPDPAGV